MRVDYRKLGQIAIDSNYRNHPAKVTSDVLANYLYLISVGDILMVDLRLCYAPELSYGHPAFVLEEWTANQNLALAYNELQGKFDSLQKEKENADSKIQKLEQQIEELHKIH